MFVFKKKKKTTGAFVAIIVVDNISSAMPFATFPIMCAVAGTISIKSAFFASDICCISQAFGSANISIITMFWLND